MMKPKWERNPSEKAGRVSLLEMVSAGRAAQATRQSKSKAISNEKRQYKGVRIGGKNYR
jgi:hypothetical protein